MCVLPNNERQRIRIGLELKIYALEIWEAVST